MRTIDLVGPKGWSHGWIRDGDTVTYTGNLGVGRGDMPQLSGTVAGQYVPSSAMVPKFIAHLRSKGIKVTRRRIPAGSLRPTQTTGSMPTIRSIADDLKSGKLADTKPILISSDNRVLDGHHNWAGRVLADSEGGREGLPAGMPVVQVSMPMADLLGEARSFDRVSHIPQRKPGQMANPAFMKPTVGFARHGGGVELAGGRVKTPGPQRAAGRRKLAVAGQALPDDSFPIPNVDYLKRAIKSVGRAPASKRPALKTLIRKRARELKATNTPGVKGTWPFQGANTGGRVIDLVGPHGYVHGWIKVGSAAHSDLERGMNPREASGVTSELDKAHAAASAGKHDTAATHLANALNRARYAPGSTASLQATIRTARTEQQAQAKAGSRLSSMNPARKYGQLVTGTRPADVAGRRAASLARTRTGKVVDLAMATMTRKMPVVRGAADVQLSRSGPGKVTVMHKSTGVKVGTLAQSGKGWQGVHSSGAKCPPSGSMGGAVAGLVAAHNQLARGKKLPPAQKDGTASYAHEAGDGINLAGSLPVTSSSDGPRVTTAGGSGSGKAGLTGEAAAVYAKLIKKGLKPGQALAMAKRAAAMKAKAASPKASAA